MKENLVSEVAARWWYVLPEWPPKDYDYTPKLSENKLRIVSVEKFNFEPEADVKGNRKVTELECYPGVFQDSVGKLYDLRPQETCPTLNNLRKKDMNELKELAIKALKIQMEQCDDTNREELEEKLKKLTH